MRSGLSEEKKPKTREKKEPRGPAGKQVREGRNWTEREEQTTKPLPRAVGNREV